MLFSQRVSLALDQAPLRNRLGDSVYFGQSGLDGFHTPRDDLKQAEIEAATELGVVAAGHSELRGLQQERPASFPRAHLEYRLVVIKQRGPSEGVAGSQR